MKIAPVSVGIPTFACSLRIFEVLQHLAVCDPLPAEIIVHVDQSNGELERQLTARFPTVRILSSPHRVGPGGGRHRCIQVASQPFFASFDDDSWPVDLDFFGEVLALFKEHPHIAVLTAAIYQRHEAQPSRSSELTIVADYNGGGHAIRIDAYRQTTGYIDRPYAYAIEEVDVAMQLHALEWTILKCGRLRVFHDTQHDHHASAEIVAGTVQNIALRAFLRYPISLWPRALLQLGNIVLDMIKRRRFAGLSKGVLGIPATLVRYGAYRRQLPADKIRSYLNSRPRLPL